MPSITRMVTLRSASAEATYRLCGDLLATVPREEILLRVWLLVSMADDALRLERVAVAREHLATALIVAAPAAERARRRAPDSP